MTPFKRGNVYWVKWMRGGKLFQKSLGTNNLKSAQKFCKAMECATELPSFEKALDFLRLFYDVKEEIQDAIPIGETYSRYESIAKAVGRDKCSDKTKRMRRERISRLLEWLSANHPEVSTIQDVTGSVATDYASSLQKQGLKTKTRANIITDIGTVWKLLEKCAASIKSPWSGLIPRDVDGERGYVFTDDEASRIMEAAKKVGKDWYLACLIARNTGLRYGDIANLEWSSVDFEHKCFRITPRKTSARDISTLIPIVNEELFDILQKKSIEAMYGKKDSALIRYVLPEHALRYGDTGRGDFDALRFREVLDLANVTNGTFHSWRHFFRTKLAEAGVATETAMRLCGHTSRETSARYDHDQHYDELRNAVASVNKTT